MLDDRHKRTVNLTSLAEIEAMGRGQKIPYDPRFQKEARPHPEEKQDEDSTQP